MTETSTVLVLDSVTDTTTSYCLISVDFQSWEIPDVTD